MTLRFFFLTNAHAQMNKLRYLYKKQYLTKPFKKDYFLVLSPPKDGSVGS